MLPSKTKGRALPIDQAMTVDPSLVQRVAIPGRDRGIRVGPQTRRFLFGGQVRLGRIIRRRFWPVRRSDALCWLGINSRLLTGTDGRYGRFRGLARVIPPAGMERLRRLSRIY